MLIENVWKCLTKNNREKKKNTERHVEGLGDVDRRTDVRRL